MRFTYLDNLRHHSRQENDRLFPPFSHWPILIKAATETSPFCQTLFCRSSCPTWACLLIYLTSKLGFATRHKQNNQLYTIGVGSFSSPLYDLNRSQSNNSRTSVSSLLALILSRDRCLVLIALLTIPHWRYRQRAAPPYSQQGTDIDDQFQRYQTSLTLRQRRTMHL